MWMAAQDHMKTIFSQRRYYHVETRFDDLEITTNKTIESTDLHGGLEMLV
jgi:hypothetical protein